MTVCDAPNGRGGAWATDGTILFSPDYSEGIVLRRVSAGGGTPEPLESLADGESTQRWPQILPGGTAVLYTSSSSSGDFSDANLVVQPLPRGPRKIVQRGAFHGRYLSSGHLLYVRDGDVVAAPFDLRRLEIVGKPVTALTGVASNADTGGAQFAVSETGTLVYSPDGPSAAERRSIGGIGRVKRHLSGGCVRTGPICSSILMADVWRCS